MKKVDIKIPDIESFMMDDVLDLVRDRMKMQKIRKKYKKEKKRKEEGKKDE